MNHLIGCGVDERLWSLLLPSLPGTKPKKSTGKQRTKLLRDKNRGARNESPGKSPRIGLMFLMSLGSFQAWASDSSTHLQCVSSWLERSKCSPGALSLPPDCTNKHLLAGSSWWHRCWVENTTGDQSAEELEVLSKESPEKLPAQRGSQCHPRLLRQTLGVTVVWRLLSWDHQYEYFFLLQAHICNRQDQVPSCLELPAWTHCGCSPCAITTGLMKGRKRSNGGIDAADASWQ